MIKLQPTVITFISTSSAGISITAQESGEGVLVKADSKAKISVVGLTPKLGR